MLIDKPLTLKEVLENSQEKEKIRALLHTVERLIADNDKGGITISFNGDWGSGKTTYLKVIESYFRDYRKCPVLFFEAWKYQDDDNPLVPLILEAREIPGIKLNMKGAFSRLLKPILTSGLTLSDKLLTSYTGLQGKDFVKIFKDLEKNQLKLISRHRNNLKLLQKTIKNVQDSYEFQRTDYNCEWNDLSKDLPSSEDKKLFVILIDDLDRLIPEKAFKIIETLRFYFDIDNVLIIMGINDDVLNKYVNKHYVTDDIRKGERFLEKIFHWNHEIPYVGLNDLHFRSLKNHLPDDKAKKRIKDILSSIDFLTHRKWIKLLNRIENNIILEGSDYSLEKVVFSATIKELYPDLELFSRKFPLIIDKLYSGSAKDNVINEAIDKITKDNIYLEFPKDNFTRIKEETERKGSEVEEV